MKATLTFFIILAMLGYLPLAHAVEYGCTLDESNLYFGDMWPEPRPHEFEVWIDDSIWADPQAASNMTGSEAAEHIRAALDRFQSDSGADIRFTFKGYSTDKTCNGSVTPYAKTTLIVSNFPGCREDAAAGAAPYIYKNCGAILFNTYSECGSNSRINESSVITHEAMHVLGFAHTIECEDTEDDYSLMSGTLWPVLTQADRRYLRSHYGFAPATLKYQYIDEFTPYGDSYGANPWWHSLTSVNNVISPVNAASTNNNNRAYIYNVPYSNNTFFSKANVYLCEPHCTVQVPTGVESYYRPSITSSTSQSTDRWLVALLTGDSFTNNLADIRISEKNHGASTWSQTTLDVNTNGRALNTAYDPVTDSFLIAYTTFDLVRVLIRPRLGGNWTSTDLYTVPGFPEAGGINSFESISIACSNEPSRAPQGQNCIFMWAEPEQQYDTNVHHAILWAPFKVVSGSSQTIEMGDIYSLGLRGYSQPAVISNPTVGADPEFLMFFNQDTTSTYLRAKNASDTTWWLSGLAGTYAGSYFLKREPWYKPVGAATRTSAGWSYIVYAE